MKNLLITLAALVLLVGCKKKESILKLSDEVKKNFSFKPGSYWIYRDSITGREDSCFVYSNAITFEKPSYCSSLGNYDRVELMNVKLKLNTSYRGNKLSHEITFYINNIFLYGWINKNDQGDESFVCYLPISQQSIERNNQNSQLIYISNMTLLGNEFEKNYKFNSGLIFNESLGLIKFKTSYDSVAYNWELIKHNVIK